MIWKYHTSIAYTLVYSSDEAVTKLGNHISTAASLGDKLSTMSLGGANWVEWSGLNVHRADLYAWSFYYCSTIRGLKFPAIQESSWSSFLWNCFLVYKFWVITCHAPSLFSGMALWVVTCSPRSQSVADAILLEVQPHLDKLRDIRSKLQKAVDAAKAAQTYQHVKLCPLVQFLTMVVPYIRISTEKGFEVSYIV